MDARRPSTVALLLVYTPAIALFACHEPAATETGRTLPAAVDPFWPDCGGDGCWQIDGEYGGYTTNGAYHAWEATVDREPEDRRDLRLISQIACGEHSGYHADWTAGQRCANVWNPNPGSRFGVVTSLKDLGPITSLESPVELAFDFRECHEVIETDSGNYWDFDLYTLRGTLHHRPYDDQEIEVAILGTYEDADGDPHEVWMTGRLLMCDELGETGYRDPR